MSDNMVDAILEGTLESETDYEQAKIQFELLTDVMKQMHETAARIRGDIR